MTPHATFKTCKKSKFDRKDTENIAIIKIFIKFYRNILSKLCLQA